ncbi:SsrA-binding protein SmpB [Clostridia bacterium OttesenSCG-928-F22]|nr:SsrA-binding protein SmpB [Clostridia bacterium OttesenSCG-928-F22]
MVQQAVKTVAQNKAARHEYYIEDTVEAGLVLSGTEVKSIRQGKANLKESYIFHKDGEMFVRGMHISPYEQGNINNLDPVRVRKLLLNKREIRKLHALTQQAGLTLIPLRLYLKQGLVKMELAVARGKKLHDKRDSDAQRTAKRDMERSMKDFSR